MGNIKKMQAQMQSLLDTAAMHNEEAQKFLELARAHASGDSVIRCGLWTKKTNGEEEIERYAIPSAYIVKAAEMWNHDRALVRSAFQVVVNNVTGD